MEETGGREGGTGGAKEGVSDTSRKVKDWKGGEGGGGEGRVKKRKRGEGEEKRARGEKEEK